MYAARNQRAARERYTHTTEREYAYFAGIGREDLFFAYVGLKSYCWKGAMSCFPSEERLAQAMHRTISTVRRRLQELQRLGVIRIIRAPQSGRRGNVYELQPMASWAQVADESRVVPEPITADLEPITHDPEPDHRRSPIQQREKTKENTQQPTASEPDPADEVVSIDILNRIGDRLKGLGSVPTSRFLASLAVYGNQALEGALDCLTEYKKHIQNPPAFLRTALEAGWAPSREYLETKQRCEVEQRARERQGPIDDLARIWGKLPGLNLADLQAQIQQNMDHSRRPLAERVHTWVELPRPFGKTEQAAHAYELAQDQATERALQETERAGLSQLLPTLAAAQAA